MTLTFERGLTVVAQRDVNQLTQKDKEYGSSWKRRGGVGAYMMLARKWDRLEEQVKRHGWDVFTAIEADPRPEGLLDDIGDLRRYLLLVENEILARRQEAAAPAPAPAPAAQVADVSRLLVEGQEHAFGYDGSGATVKWREMFPAISANAAEVGYGKPPVQHRFKPGQSGNPNGRPRNVAK